jgi:hypothetical protein
LPATRQGQLRFPVDCSCAGTLVFRQQQCEQHRSFDVRGTVHVFPEAKGSRKSAATSVVKIRFADVDEKCAGFFPNPIKMRFPFRKNLKPKYDDFCSVYLRWPKGPRSDSAQSNLWSDSGRSFFRPKPACNQGQSEPKKITIRPILSKQKKGADV